MHSRNCHIERTVTSRLLRVITRLLPLVHLVCLAILSRCYSTAVLGPKVSNRLPEDLSRRTHSCYSARQSGSKTINKQSTKEIPASLTNALNSGHTKTPVHVPLEASFSPHSLRFFIHKWTPFMVAMPVFSKNGKCNTERQGSRFG